jgi:hypothetical protein
MKTYSSKRTTLALTNSMQRIAVALALALGTTLAQAADSVLWVGNSRTYVGNLPEVYKALVKAVDRRDIKADMLVEGGGSLSGRVRSHALERELKRKRFDAVLLQERGNLVTCILSKSEQDLADCKSSAAAFDELAQVARTKGANVYLMGTHQDTDAKSRAINQAETLTAARIKANGHVPLGVVYAAALKLRPGFRWVMPDDGYHPNRDLTLLMAVLSYRVIENKWPVSVDISLEYRAFDNSVGFSDDRLGSTQNTSFGRVREVVPAEHLAEIIEIAKTATK